MSAQVDIYDFEGVMESALKVLFNAIQITAYTTQDLAPSNADGTPVIDFQLKRPCVTITFQPGQADGQWFPLQTVAGLPKQPANSSWSGAFHLEIITDAKIAVHTQYRAMTRWIMNTMGAQVNGTAPMTRHRIQPWFLDGGTTVTAKTDEGYLLTRMTYNIHFSIQADAWAELGDQNAIPVIVPSQPNLGVFNTGGPPVDAVTPVRWFLVQDQTGTYLVPGYQ